MPELGESVHEGTVSRWLKKEGDFVKEDEPVVEIMTDKVNTELQAPASGVLVKILVQEGSPVEVFHAMGLIEEHSEAGKETKASPKAPENIVPNKLERFEEKEAGIAPGREVQPVSAPRSSERKWYTPVVRSIAKQNDLSDDQLAGIAGTGAGGRVTKRDVEAYIGGMQVDPTRANLVEVKGPPVWRAPAR